MSFEKIVYLLQEMASEEKSQFASRILDTLVAACQCLPKQHGVDGFSTISIHSVYWHSLDSHKVNNRLSQEKWLNVIIERKWTKINIKYITKISQITIIIIVSKATTLIYWYI